MALDRRQQVHLYERCRDALGDEAAGYLMSELPPFEWDAIATKHDVKHGLEVLEHKLTAAFEQALRTQTKTYIAWTTALTAMLVAVFTAIGR